MGDKSRSPSSQPEPENQVKGSENGSDRKLSAEMKFEILKWEMSAVQDGMRTYGQVQFTIKGWAITVFSGFIFFAVKEDEPMFLILCAISVFLFWILDAIFKSIQKVYIIRAGTIELCLREDRLPAVMPGIEKAFSDYWNKKEQIKKALEAGREFQLALLYLVMIVAIEVLGIVWLKQH
jgi:hypothetical protein